MVCWYSIFARTDRERCVIDDEVMQMFLKYVTQRYASLHKCNSLCIDFA